MIALEDLSVAYDGHRVVEGVSLQVPEGGSFALVGESGSGKSTVLKAIAGLATEREGMIELAGRPLPPRPTRASARLMQMVFQDPYASLHPRRTVDATLSEPLAIHGLTDRDARVESALRDVGLDRRFRFRYPHQLSGGQRQRVAIARALAPEPRVILLDEPTSALDVSVQAEILNLLSDLRTEHGLTYLMVSHDLGVIGHMCDRIAVMQHGKIVELLDVAKMRSLKADHPYTQHLLDSAMRSVR